MSNALVVLLLIDQGLSDSLAFTDTERNVPTSCQSRFTFVGCCCYCCASIKNSVLALTVALPRAARRDERWASTQTRPGVA